VRGEVTNLFRIISISEIIDEAPEKMTLRMLRFSQKGILISLFLLRFFCFNQFFALISVWAPI
jgi:hypothetical protein